MHKFANGDYVMINDDALGERANVFEFQSYLHDDLVQLKEVRNAWGNKLPANRWFRCHKSYLAPWREKMKEIIADLQRLLDEDPHR